MANEDMVENHRPAPATIPTTSRSIYSLPELEARATEDGRVFYLDRIRKTVTWEKPGHDGKLLSLPDGWQARATGDGRIYYLDHNTQSSSWVRPVSNDGTHALPEGWCRVTASDPTDPLDKLEVEIARCRLNLWQEGSSLDNLLCKKYALQHKNRGSVECAAADLALLHATPISGSTLGTYAWRLNGVASSFTQRTRANRSSKDYQRSIYFRRSALLICPLRYDHLRTIIRLQMALSMLSRSVENADLELLDEACAQAETALFVDGAHVSARPEQTNIFAYMLRQRYLKLRNLHDLNRSIELSEQASDLEMDYTSPYGDYENFAFSLYLRHCHTGDREDLDRAIAVYSQHIQRRIYSADSYGRRVKQFTALLYRRYNLLQKTSDLKTAIGLLGRAIFRLPTTSPWLADLCSDAMQYLLACSERDSKTNYLERATAFAGMGLQQENVNSDKVSQLLLGIGKCSLRRYIQSGRPSDQGSALHFFQETLAISGNDAFSLTAAWSWIGRTYETIYSKTGDQKFLQIALKSSTRGLETAGHENTWHIYSQAARYQAQLFRLDENCVRALSEAVNLIEKALQAAKGRTISERASVWCVAGQIYSVRFEQSRESEDFTTAMTLLTSCWRTQEAEFSKRVQSMRLVGGLFSKVERWSDAWEHLSEAVQFVSHNFPPNLSREETQEVAKQLSGLASQACAAGIAVGQTAAALEHLEQGRGLLVSSIYGASSDVEMLRTQHPLLHSAFVKLRQAALEKSNSSPDTQLLPSVFTDFEMQRDTADEGLRKEIDMIRKMPGYQRFLLPLRACDMQKLARDGAIVVVNNTENRNDAILVTKDEIKALRLPESPKHFIWRTELSLSSSFGMDKLAHEIPTDGKLDKSSQNVSLAALLEGLWELVVGPVLDALQFSKERTLNYMRQNLVGKTRIWWIVTGTLSRLPLHAAGMWLQKPQETIVGRAISSYVATFRMLAYTRQRSVRRRTDKATGLFVSMAKPALDKRNKIFLQSAEEEEQRVRNVNSGIEWASLLRGSAADFLEEAPKHSFLHVATHGVSDPEDPSKSNLVFMRLQKTSEPGGQSIPIPDRLTVVDISERDGVADTAVLAFLAACSTADSRPEKLGDEGLQISNAFHLAGFPHVIGSLWPANEFICPDFAEHFYRFLGEHLPKDGIPDNDLVAAAYTVATHKLLYSDFENLRFEPLLWAGFVHMGP